MNRIIIVLGTVAFMTLMSCSQLKYGSADRQSQKDFEQLYEMMSGEFSSEEQSINDSLFYNINLMMYPIWSQDRNAKWLYVEQAVTEYLDKPYRQRVYRLSLTKDQLIESRVYELNTPKNYIHGWNDPRIFDLLTPDSLSLRTGCAVYLEKKGDCFSGSTYDKDCRSSLRGASYATSKVQICEDQIVSWDQGWDSMDTQVWGAETEGYIFKRK